MPELPEVETIRRDLEPFLNGRTLVRIDHQDPRRYRDLARALGASILGIGRRGKYLMLDLGAIEMIVHLGMTGQVGVGDPALFRHLRVSCLLDSGEVFFLNDPRRFGKVLVVDKGDYSSLPTLSAMGPEPLGPDYRFEPFYQICRQVRTIKSHLLDQRLVAGVGNIYADEALHLARIHPSQGYLTKPEAQRLFEAVPKVLWSGVVNRGTTFKDYRDGMGRYGGNQDFLRVYDREGEPCQECGTLIVKTRVAQRGTYYCPRCQSLKKR